MSESPRRDAEWRERLDAFLREFFAAPGNDAWPDLAPDFGWANRVEPFVELARRAEDGPLVLPRMVSSTDTYAMYVITPDKADTIRTAELITAFAGPTYSRLPRVMQPSVLDADDAVDAAVLRFVGPGTTFKVQTSGQRSHRHKLTDALLLMQRTLARRPPRRWNTVKPVGRLLAEFDAAVAAGSDSTSARLLDQLDAVGGLDAANIAYLRIKRLSRLGKNAEVLALPRLADVVRQGPPAPVRDAILSALYFQFLDEPLKARDSAAARSALRVAGRHVPDLMTGDLTRLSAESMTVLAVAGLIRDDAGTLARIVDSMRSTGRFDQVDDIVRTEVAEYLRAERRPSGEAPVPVEDTAEPEPSGPPALRTWLDFIEAVAAGDRSARRSVDDNSWENWEPPSDHDVEIAALLDDLPTESAQRVWAAVGPFIEAVGYAHPAGSSARAFIRNALTFDRFSPGDLLALQALIEITLRRAPSAREYSELLEDIGAESRRWVAIEQAAVVLDIVDSLVLAACPDPSARQNLAIRLLAPLAQHSSRLDHAQLAVARLLTDELDLGLTWPEPEDVGHEVPTWQDATLSLLLYSLDERVLARTAEQLSRIVPRARVVTASDHVGSPQLRQRTQHADVIVMVTRCATHAATGFIGQHADSDKIVFVEGSGAASVLRTALTEIRRRVEGA